MTNLHSVSEKAMAPHSSTLAWKIPWVEEPGRLQSMGSLSRTWLRDFTFTFHFPALEKEMATDSSVLAWRIPGTGEPGGCRLWGRIESDTTDVTAAAADSVLKSRDITLPTKVHIVKTMLFPVVMYGYGNRTLKKAECQRIDAFKLWC